VIDLSDHHVFVVGGSRGIGAASARLAAELGADVSLVYRSAADEAEAVCAAVRAAGRRALAIQADVAQRDAMLAAAQRAAAELGPIRGAVISAAILERTPLGEVDQATWQRALDVNLSGTLWSAQAAIAHMPGPGSIVIYSSTAGQHGGGGGSPYCVTKAAQIKLAAGLAKELGPRGIRVNTVAPAWTETDMAAPHIAHRKAEVASGFPLGRVGRPEDVAKATCYLLSDVAGFVTGTVHTVDGGAAMKG